MRLQTLTLIAFAIATLVGCQRLPVLGGPQPPVGQPPVIVVPEPAIAVPVPLGPGETLVEQPPMYLAPGVAPPPQAIQPTPRGSVGGGPVVPRAPNLFDRLSGGEAISPRFGLPRAPTVGDRVPNPIVVPVANAELAWDAIADVVSDYFPIKSEQPVQLLGGMVTEGRIETAAVTGATLFEPQRRDSVGWFNRWQATFQTIRRRALVSVTPAAGGYAVGVRATKEIEDLPQPLGATAGAASLRNDQALPSERLVEDYQTRSSGRWVPLGRDEPLEQEMLRQIRQRLAGGR